MPEHAFSTPTDRTGTRRELTQAQRGIWYAQHLAPDNAMYQIAQYVHIRGDLDLELMRRAAATAIARTQALNVRFTADDDGPHQVVEPSRVQLGLTDLRPSVMGREPTGDLPTEADSPEQTARALMETDLATARNVAVDPLLRLELFRIDDHRYFFYQRAHHLMLDGYSAVLVLKRISQLYDGLLNGKRTNNALPDSGLLAVQASADLGMDALLADEARYQSSGNAEADKEFWQNTFIDAEPASGLAQRPQRPAAELIRQSDFLPPEAVAGLADAAGSAPALILTTAALYVHKMTGERVVSLGLPVTARRGALAKSVPSMLSNIVPIRVELTPEETIAKTVAATGDGLRNALIHQRFRYQSLDARPGYIGPSINILPVVADIHFGAASCTMNILSTGPIDDLSIVIHGLSSDQVTVQFEANADLYTPETVADHLRRFIGLLTDVAAAPDAAVASLTVTTPDEAQALLETGSSRCLQLPSHTVAEEFEARAAATPGVRALVAEDGELSFAELDQKSNQLAHYLHSQGAKSGTSVAVRLGRTTALAVAILGVLKSGAAYVPLDPDYPAGRVEGMLEDAAPLLLLTSVDLSREGSNAGITSEVPEVVLDSKLFASVLAGKPALRPDKAAAGGHDLAYIIFTSGSTGRPKAVGVEHRALLNLFASHNADIFGPAQARLGRTLRVAHTAGLSFDASWDPILWLIAGHELHLVDNLTRRDPEAMARYLAQAQIDSIETTPSFAKVLLAEGLFDGGFHPSVIALGGEAVDPGLWGVLAQLEAVTAYNFYGPTETTVDTMTAVMEPGTTPILGGSVANSRHYILDSGLNPVPGNAIGELYVAGHNVARGYLDQPQLSSERFVADPFAANGSRMYRTGDVVRRSPDGGVEFLGRIDQQVKIRGFRVELSEIEHVLRAADGVDHAAVVVGRNRAGYDQLLAYVTGADELDTTALRGTIRQTLPDYMVPAAVVRIPAIPLTRNGKLDRSALPDPETGPESSGPRNAQERTVAEAFTEVLGLDSVGMDDDFFELGGHSLLATRLVAVLREKHGSAPALRAVFETPTVAGLAQALTAPAFEPHPLDRQNRPRPLPLSYAQRRLWFLNRFDADSGAYNIPIVLRLGGRLDVAALEEAVNDVVTRHESLRTIFPLHLTEPHDGEPHDGGPDAGGPEQLILSADAARVPVIAVQTNEEQLERVIRSESARGFDVTKDLPLRAVLLQLNAQEHVLLLTLHHISADGWSLAPLARDLSTAYTSRCQGRSPDFAPLPVQYADYSLWQRAELGSENDPQSPISRQLAFWSKELAASPEELQLPFDHARGTHIQQWSPASVPVHITAATHERLAALAREHNASLFMVLQAAFAALLSKLGAGTDIPIGTPVAGRSDTALDDLVGFFVNTLVLRTDTSGNPTLGELVDTVRFTNLRAYANQDAPFERVVEQLNPARSQDRHPLFQVMLTLTNDQPSYPKMAGLTVAADRTAEPGGAKFDLLMDLADVANPVESLGEPDTGGPDDGQPGHGQPAQKAAAGLTGSLSFDPALFEPATAALIAERFLRVLEQFAAAPQTPLSRLRAVTSEETVRAPEQNRGPDVDNDGRSVLAEFTASAARNPERIAVSSGTSTVSFGDLAGQVELLAEGLVASGIAPGDRVAVALPRTPDVVCAALAVLRAGAVYVPVDLSYPTERIELILQDSAPSVTITADNFAALKAAGGTESTARALAARIVGDADPAYLIYTSGSTGKPKGVAVTHAALANLYLQHLDGIFAESFGSANSEGPAVAHITGLGFDAAWDPMLWLVAGATLHLVSDEIRTDAEALVRFCHDNGITVLETTPSYLKALLISGLLAGPRPEPLILALGGESVPLDLWQELAATDNVIAYNFYGPTEFTVDSVLGRITGEVPNIGRPIRNVQAYLLDDYLTHVPQGVTGELYLAGTSMATGYVSRAAETAGRFVANPFDSGTRMYRTGDLVKQLPGGELQFAGRADDQLKLRGFRIEPGEIESVLSRHEAVQRAAVVLESVGPEATAQRLVGYFVGGADPDELRRFAAQRLPDYMVPRILVPLAEIPLSAHGKLDKRALPAPDARSQGSRSPQTKREKTMCAAFSAVLGSAEVGMDDDFFELGGHSLLAVSLIARLRVAFGVELPLRALFETPTPAALLGALTPQPGGTGRGPQDNDDDGAAAGATVPASLTSVVEWTRRQQTSRPDRIPLSYAQSRMWFLNQLDPGSADYNIALAIRLTGELDTEALASALDDVVARHEILRTSYPAGDGTPEQLIHPAAAVTGNLAYRAAGAPEDLRRLLAAEASAGFDVSVDLPLRCTLVRLDDDEWVLQLVIHHIASDGASLAPLARDVSTAYSARCSGANPMQRVLGLQYADFALWQRDLLDGTGSCATPAVPAPAGPTPGVPALDAKLQSWARTLAGAPAELALPSDGQRAAQARQPGGQHSFTLDARTATALSRMAASQSASLFMVLHAALGGFLNRIGAGDDLVIGSPTAGRKDPALAELIGFFVNTVPIRLDASGNPSFLELLAAARNSVLAAFDKDDVPFERLVEAVNPPRELGRHPLFQTMLTVENNGRAVVELPGVQAVPEPEIGSGEAKFDLSFSFRELGPDGGLAAVLEYNAAMFSRGSIADLVRWFEAFVQLAVESPERPISSLEILPPEEISSLMAATAGLRSEDGYPAPGILSVFSSTVARQPGDTAVVCGGESLTFAALEAAAERIATGLLESGVGSGEVVSVYLPRSLHTVAAALGVLKAGAAYNPIDTEYPAERVAAILEDAKAAAVISTALVDDALRSAGTSGSPVYLIEDLLTGEASVPAAIANCENLPADQLAYVMFTSGSTGRPKGVEISHGALANLLASHRGTLLPDPTERATRGPVRIAHTTGVGFDASWDPMLWMIDGHELHMITDDVRLDPQRLAGYFAHHDIGSWETTPGYLRQLLAEPAFVTMLDERHDGGRPALRLALGGEAFDDVLWADLAARESVQAWNLYGPTEATVDSLVAAVTGAGRPVLGKPMLNSRAYVLDDYLQHVPAGTRGELYLAGPQLARGYRGRADLSAERFVADPFWGSGERMYRTGDLVSRSAHGDIAFHGRNDDQVKIRGFRVELGEVERVLLSVPGVGAALARVMMRTSGDGSGAPGDARLLAYLVAEPPRSDASADVSDLSELALAHARTALPGYMVPAAVVMIDEIPLTTHGKVDAAALPDMTELDRSAGLPPRTPREKVVAQIFEEVLSLPRVGVDESFFDLGGHSFLAQPLISRINAALGTDLPVQSIFRSPSVEQLLYEVSKGTDGSVADSLRGVLPLRTNGSKAPLFAVHPATGVSWGYAAMLRRLDGERPLIGLQMPGMVPGEDHTIEAESLTGLADEYLARVREIQPTGPYYLIGWSFGGNLVHRLATRLQDLGHEVAFLGILDAYPTQQEGNSDIGTGPALWQSYLQAAGFPVPADEAGSLDGARVLEILRGNHNPLGSISLESLNAMVENFQLLAGLIRRTPVDVYNGDLHLFRATQDVPEGSAATSSWAPYVTGRIVETAVHERHSRMLSERALDDISPVLAIQLGDSAE